MTDELISYEEAEDWLNSLSRPSISEDPVDLTPLDRIRNEIKSLPGYDPEGHKKVKGNEILED